MFPTSSRFTGEHVVQEDLRLTPATSLVTVTSATFIFPFAVVMALVFPDFLRPSPVLIPDFLFAPSGVPVIPAFWSAIVWLVRCLPCSRMVYGASLRPLQFGLC